MMIARFPPSSLLSSSPSISHSFLFSPFFLHLFLPSSFTLCIALCVFLSRVCYPVWLSNCQYTFQPFLSIFISVRAFLSVLLSFSSPRSPSQWPLFSSDLQPPALFPTHIPCLMAAHVGMPRRRPRPSPSLPTLCTYIAPVALNIASLKGIFPYASLLKGWK